MLHNTELDIAYNDGVVQGVEQKEIEVIKNMLELKLPISTIAKTLNISSPILIIKSGMNTDELYKPPLLFRPMCKIKYHTQ